MLRNVVVAERYHSQRRSLANGVPSQIGMRNDAIQFGGVRNLTSRLRGRALSHTCALRSF
ncbi:hypothetical protein Pla52n_07090 [Stieleria varia]|uniref:Uncharacterized protein n=1 Tax=Stieleria varia TaxID=2528005 RepID=A0A5C6B8N5_9BACT|nr:hypothetical protein Pla52n_07090 [Stieleria varia]